MSTSKLLSGSRTVEERLADLEALEAARALLNAYARGCDENNAEEVAALFTADGVLDANGTTHAGQAAVAAFYADRLDTPTRHFVTNTSFVANDQGELEATSLFLALTAPAGTSNVTVGTYSDRIVIKDGRALFQSRAIRIDVSNDLSDGWSNLSPRTAEAGR